MDNYKMKLLQMVMEMKVHEVIYAFTFLSRTLGYERDPDNAPDHMTVKEMYIADMLEKLPNLDNSNLDFIGTLIDKMIKEQESAA